MPIYRGSQEVTPIRGTIQSDRVFRGLEEVYTKPTDTLPRWGPIDDLRNTPGARLYVSTSNSASQANCVLDPATGELVFSWAAFSTGGAFTTLFTVQVDLGVSPWTMPHPDKNTIPSQTPGLMVSQWTRTGSVEPFDLELCVIFWDEGSAPPVPPEAGVHTFGWWPVGEAPPTGQRKRPWSDWPDPPMTRAPVDGNWSFFMPFKQNSSFSAGEMRLGNLTTRYLTPEEAP